MSKEEAEEIRGVEVVRCARGECLVSKSLGAIRDELLGEEGYCGLKNSRWFCQAHAPCGESGCMRQGVHDQVLGAFLCMEHLALYPRPTCRIGGCTNRTDRSWQYCADHCAICSACGEMVVSFPRGTPETDSSRDIVHICTDCTTNVGRARVRRPAYQP